MGGTAWVTLATNDSYSLGALVLAHSLKKVNTVHQLAVLITPAVSPAMREQLESIFDLVKLVDVLDSKDEANLALLKRPELGITFTKLHCWTLTQFEKGVFLDADTLVVRNCDELFEREEFSAAPDVGWPDCFNSGVFVFRPSVVTFNNLVQFAVEKGSFDGGDQGLLNQFFSTWATDDIQKHLPFVYNLTSVAVYSYIPAFKQFGSDTRIVHFIGPIKPWLQAVDPATRTVTPSSDSSHLQPLLQQWWDIFIEKVHPTLSTNLDSASGMLRNFALPECTSDPLEPNPSPPGPAFPEPYTPYIERDDERQLNLPYQPFQVVSSEGELLNITFADFARENEQTDEDSTKNEEPSADPTPEPEPLIESALPDSTSQDDDDGGVEPPPPEVLPEKEPEPENPFSYQSFVPDESCINAYLEHNIQQYQPFENYQEQSTLPPPPAEEPTLPRFLTIAQDDPRQGHVPYHREPSPERQDSSQESGYSSHQTFYEQSQPACQHEQRTPSPAEPPQIPRSKSTGNLVIDATDASSFPAVTSWKSQPDIAPPETKKLPGLKPLKPKENSPQKVEVMPKFTEFTEFFMNNQYRDPFAPPVDKLGFVERAILQRVHSKKALLDVVESPTAPPPSRSPSPKPLIILEMNTYVDLIHCNRQAGNVSKTPDSKENIKKSRSSRRGKRAKRSVEVSKPPEEVKNYDVDAILQRLSTLSTGYAPIVPPAPIEPTVPVNSEEDKETLKQWTPPVMEQPRLLPKSPPRVSENFKSKSDRVESDTVIEKKVGRKDFKKKSRRFGPLADVPPLNTRIGSPFAAPLGESLSEQGPEILVIAPTPVDESAKITETHVKALNQTYVIGGDTDGVNFTDEEKINAKEGERFERESRIEDSSGMSSEYPTESIQHLAQKVEKLTIESNLEEAPYEKTSEEAPTSQYPPPQENGNFTLAESYGIIPEESQLSKLNALLKNVENNDTSGSAQKVQLNGDLSRDEVITNSSAEELVTDCIPSTTKILMPEPPIPENEICELVTESISATTSKIIPVVTEPSIPENGICKTPVAQDVIPQTEMILTEHSNNSTSNIVEAEQIFAVVDNNDRVESGEIEEISNLCDTRPVEECVPDEDVLKIDVDRLVDEEDLRLGSLETCTPSKIASDPFRDGQTKTPLPVYSTMSFKEFSYAAAAKKEVTASGSSSKEPTVVYFAPESPQQHIKPVSLKHPRKVKSPKIVAAETRKSETGLSPSSSVKYAKRKAEKPDIEFPTNRFELLPQEKIGEVTHRKKKTKTMSKKFSAPASTPYSLSLPSTLQTESIVPASQEEPVYLPEPDDIPGIAGAIAQLKLDPADSSTPESSTAQAEFLRRQSWETGKMDYMNRDSFSNIWSKISETLSQSPIPENPSSPSSPDPSQ